MSSLRPTLAALLMFALGCSSSSSTQTTPPPAAAEDAGPSPSATPDAGPAPIEWGVCPDRFRDQCATIAMPLDHARPDGETIDVFVSRRGTGKRQLWLLQGGPGGSAEAFFGLHDFLSNLDPELEVYTIEHRGVGDSTRLGCAAEKSSTPGGSKILETEWPACRDEVVQKWGDRLQYFSTTQAAHDLSLAIQRTRRPEQKVFVYGGSYGTYWANRFGVLHPDRADGIVLDAPVQPNSDLYRYDLQFEPVGRKIFSELCPQAPRCAEHLGADPLAFLDRVVAKLRAGHCGELGVDMDTWKTVFGVFLMDYNLRNWLPALIYRLDRCGEADQTAIATLFGNIFRGGAGVPRKSDVLQVHVLLSEFWPRTHVDDAEIKAANAKATFFQNAVAHTFAMQDTWPRYAPDPMVNSYMPANLPVVTLAGSLDPAAPPALVGYGYRDQMKGPHQTFVEIPYGAHTVLTSGAVAPDQPGCPAQLVKTFLLDPKAALPTECAAKVLKPSFDAPAALATKYFGTADIYK
jgi:pimeloyl-ACP methyl ester carboxylesterase